MMDIDRAAKAMRDEEMLQEIEDFIEGFNQPVACGSTRSGCTLGRASTAGVGASAADFGRCLAAAHNAPAGVSALSCEG